MFKTFGQIFFATAFWVVFIFVIFQIPYPQNLVQASIVQLLLFFIPLAIALASTLNFFVRNIYISFSISLTLISLLILNALDILNLVTFILTLITAWLLISYFKKTKSPAGLTNHSKIPKLTGLKRG